MSSPRPLPRLIVVLFACSSFLGCGGDDAPTDAAADAEPIEGAVSCQADPRLDPYAVNLAKMGTSGAYEFVLVASDPAPPGKGLNTWTVRLNDASHSPLSGASLTGTATMPDHGHPSSARPVVTVNADGTYKIENLNLFMAGVWKIALTANVGATTDTTTFTFCVEG